MSELGLLLTLEYGEALPAHARTGSGYPVFGSNGIVGYHESILVEGPGIVVGRKGSVGKVVWSDQGFWPIDTTYYVRSAGDDLGWIYRVLDWLPLAALDTSTGVPGLNRNDVYRISVFRPALEEQGKIAQILDTLDTQIRQTEALIAKLERIKQGLLTDLLTRGIDQNGQLRPTPDQAPHLYKDSPLGRIPKEWEVCTVGESLEHIIDFRGRTPKKLGMEWGGGDILALSANNVKMGGIDTSREAYYGSPELYAKWMTQGDTKEGDILLTMEAPLGNVAQVPDEKLYIHSQRVVLLRFRPNHLLNEFAFWQLQSQDIQQRMVRRSTGTTATGIQRAQLVKLNLMIPSVCEQVEIDARLRSIDARLAREQELEYKLVRHANVCTVFGNGNPAMQWYRFRI